MDSMDSTEIRTTRPSDGVAVLHLPDELEAYTALLLRLTYPNLITEGRVELVVDMTAVEFVDSIGLVNLVFAHRQAEAHGGRLVLAGASRPVHATIRDTASRRRIPVTGRPLLVSREIPPVESLLPGREPYPAIPAGTIVYAHTGATYGCLDWTETAVILDPARDEFRGVPADAVADIGAKPRS